MRRLAPLAVVLACATPAPRLVPTAATEANPPLADLPSVPEAFWEQFDRRCEQGLALAHLFRDAAASGPDALEALHRHTVVLANLAGEAALLIAAGAHDAAARCQSAVRAHSGEVALDPKIYDALSVLEPPAGGEAALERFLFSFRRSGAFLPAPARSRLAQLRVREAELVERFERRFDEDVRTVWARPGQLGPLAPLFSDRRTDGRRVSVTTRDEDRFPVLVHGPDPELREALTRAELDRGRADNRKAMTELLGVRKEIAEQLGFASWLDYVTYGEMAETSTAVGRFTEAVGAAVAPRLERERAALLEEKRSFEPTAKRVELWDRLYLVERLRRRYELETVRDYFPRATVVAGAISLVERWTGLRFVPEPDAPAWDPGVSRYRVEQGGVFAGRLYLDLDPRPEKNPRLATYPLRIGLFGEQAPEVAVLASWPGGDKARLEHEQVLGLLHELGYVAHHLLNRNATWANLAGLSSVEWDFLEVPALWFEELGWSAEALRVLSAHVESKEPLPETLATRLVEARAVDRAIRIATQLAYVELGRALYTADPSAIDLDQTAEAALSRFDPFPVSRSPGRWTSHRAIARYGGRDYAHLWSLAITKELKGGLDAPTSLAQLLAQGGRRPAGELLAEALGRRPSLDGLRRWLAP